MNYRKKLGSAMIIMFATILLPVIISAHDMWIEIPDYAPAPGSQLSISYPSDHTFPPQAGEFVSANKVARSYLISPTGRTIGIALVSKDRYRSTARLNEKGTYLAVSGKKWMYWTKTTTGWEKGKHKLQVKGAVKCVNSGKFCKAIVNVGQPKGKVYSRIIGHDLEIVPQKDPGMLIAGDRMPVKIIFKGKPLSTEVKATYSGYSKRKNSFAVKTKSDNSGITEIKLKKKGKWLIQVSHQLPSLNSRICDEVLYSATLTFEIK